MAKFLWFPTLDALTNPCCRWFNWVQLLFMVKSCWIHIFHCLTYFPCLLIPVSLNPASKKPSAPSHWGMFFTGDQPIASWSPARWLSPKGSRENLLFPEHSFLLRDFFCDFKQKCYNCDNISPQIHVGTTLSNAQRMQKKVQTANASETVSRRLKIEFAVYTSLGRYVINKWT